jgi:hypothetical protein
MIKLKNLFKKQNPNINMRHVIKTMPHPHVGMQPNACYTYKTKTNNESHKTQPAGYSLVKQVQVERGAGGKKEAW